MASDWDSVNLTQPTRKFNSFVYKLRQMQDAILTMLDQELG